MKHYFIDTSVIVSYLREKEGVAELFDSLEGELSSSYVCMAELYEGVFRVKERGKVEKGILQFFSGLSKVYGMDPEVSREFGKIRANLKRKGKIIEDLDIILAAICVANNLVLVTSNPKHFKRVKNLRILEV